MQIENFCPQIFHSFADEYVNRPLKIKLQAAGFFEYFMK